eukprot:11232485-Alexandrium_andersonii.AAC.1
MVVTVRGRIDRERILIVIFHASKQVFQMRNDILGAPEATAKFFVGLAEEFVQHRVLQADLYKRKAEKFRELKVAEPIPKAA